MFRFAKCQTFFLTLLSVLCLAVAAKAETPRPADEVFPLAVSRMAGGDIALRWTVAAGNYLYRDSLTASLAGREQALVTPPGEEKDDPTFGRVEIYPRDIEAQIAGLPGFGLLEVSYQGCAEQGICYPPVVKEVDLADLSIQDGKRGLGGSDFAAHDPAGETPWPVAAPVAAPGEAPPAVLTGSLFAMAAAFLGFGLLLSFTPCVFPMVPILSAMLAGAGEKLSTGRGFVLSATYVGAMAAAYGVVGLAAGWSGANLQALLQAPWALLLAAAVFIALALSMFGLFEIALPPALAGRLFGTGRRGSIGGAAMLGFGSALIVGPCVTPPLAAAMLYAVQTGEAVRGAAALFFLGLGMGLPLIAVGTFGARILPRPGPWLDGVRRVFGAVFLGVAAMLVARLLPGPAALALFGAMALAASVFLGAFDRITAASGWQPRLAKTAGLAAFVYGAVLLVGASGGASDPFRPLGFLAAGGAAPVTQAARGERASSPAAFDAALAGLAAEGKPILVSFTADWCTTCKSNEAVMNEPAIRDRLRALPSLVADVTAQDAPARELMTRFSVVGPPTLFFLDARGREIPGSRIIGPITAGDIEQQLVKAGA